MRIVRLAGIRSDWIREFQSRGVRVAELTGGSGEAHFYVLRFEPGSAIGEHKTGFGQLLIVLEGSGWVEQAGHRRDIGQGFAAIFECGVMHAKGSDSGMLALMVQVENLAMAPDYEAGE